MAVLLQHTNTKLFFKSKEQWVSDPKDAQEFPTALNAFFLSIQQDAIHCEVVEQEPNAGPEAASENTMYFKSE